MGELAELLEWAGSLLHEVLAHLGLVFLLELVELTLVSIEVIVVILLCEMSEHFTWRVVEVSWSTVSVVTLTFVSLFLGWRLSLLLLSGLVGSSRWFNKGRSSWLLLLLGGLCWGRVLNNFSVDWLGDFDVSALGFLLL